MFSDDRNIEEIFQNYFTNLFTSERGNDMVEVLDEIEALITEAKNDVLTKDI